MLIRIKNILFLLEYETKTKSIILKMKTKTYLHLKNDIENKHTYLEEHFIYSTTFFIL